MHHTSVVVSDNWAHLFWVTAENLSPTEVQKKFSSTSEDWYSCCLPLYSPMQGVHIELHIRHVRCRFINTNLVLLDTDCLSAFDIPTVHRFSAEKIWGGNKSAIVGSYLHRSQLVNSRFSSAPNTDQSKLMDKLQRTWCLSNSRKAKNLLYWNNIL